MFGQNKSNNKYYSVLGLKKDSKADEIKKAYKKLAIKYHPDRNTDNKKEAEKKFAEINEAYSILTDPKKKQQYDMYGTVGSGTSEANPVNTFRMFNNIFQQHVSEFINRNNTQESSGSGFSNIFNELNNSTTKEFPLGGIKFKVHSFKQSTPQRQPVYRPTRPARPPQRPFSTKPVHKQPVHGQPVQKMKPKEQTVHKSFEISDIYNGVTKEVEIDLVRRTRNLNGQIVYRNIKKKFKIPLKGREIFVENWGNHLSGYKKPADLLIMVNDFPNDKFKRFGDYNLFIIHKIKGDNLPKKNLLEVELPNGKNLEVKVDMKELLKDTNKLIKIEGKGFPYIIDKEVKRGNLFIKVEVIFEDYQVEETESSGESCNFIKMFDVF